jgi:hypothetical protein
LFGIFGYPGSSKGSCAEKPMTVSPTETQGPATKPVDAWIKGFVFAVLVALGLGCGYLAWQGLFSLDPVSAGLNSIVAMIAFWGAFRIINAEKGVARKTAPKA